MEISAPIRPALLAGALLLCGCPSRQTVPQPPPTAVEQPPPIKVPAGCERDLSGVYLYSGRPLWRYLGTEEDGGAFSLAVGVQLPDGGLTGVADGGVRIHLLRTPDGFRGAATAVAFTAGGKACPVAFPTEVTACPDGGLVLVSTDSVVLNEQCAIPPGTPQAPRREHHLVRASTAAPPDAGVTVSDAGTAPVDGGVQTDAGS